MHSDIVITGRGIICCLGDRLPDIWEALLSSKSGIRPAEDAGVPGFPHLRAATAPSINPSDLGIDRRDVRIMGKPSFMLIKAAIDAYKTACIEGASFRQEDIGFFAGIGMFDYNAESLLPSVIKSLDGSGCIDYDRFYSGGYREIYPLWPLSMLNNIAFCQAAIRLDIKGENAVFSPHADSGALAIAEAARTLLEQKAVIALAGGVSESVSSVSMARAALAGGLGSDQDFALGEGCGMICLETRGSADMRKVPYTTMVTGFASSCDTEDVATGPSADAMSQAMRECLRDASLAPDDIDLVISDCSGLQCETEAIDRTFRDAKERPAVFSSKAALGDLLAAGPAVNVILGSCMIEHGIMPKTVSVISSPNVQRPRKIMINAFSYEGQCSSLIIEAA